MGIPPFQDNGNLPPGEHAANWQEVTERFGWNAHRQQLLQGLERAARELAAAGCETLYLDGSFVTRKDYPRDFDGCWDLQGVDVAQLDPVLKDFRHPRTAQKAMYGGELFIAEFPADPSGKTFLDFFQIDRATGELKGILRIDLRSLP